MIRSLWTIMALVGFMSLSIFGVILMPYDSSLHGINCLASLINNSESPCPKDDPLGFASFHGGAVQKILNLIPVDAVSIAYFALISGLILYGMMMFRLVQNNLGQPVLVSFTGYITESFPLRTKNLSWFSLHENSPSLSWGNKVSC